MAPRREEVQRRIEELGTWFHNIEIDGVQTAPSHFLGNYPAFKWDAIQRSLPNDLRGWTVLDVGCNAGFHSIQLKKRGADRVLGIDSSPTYLAQAQFAAEMSQVDIEFRRLDVYELDQLGERFDLVLFMGVLYHLRHPLLALDLLHQHAVKHTMVVQSLLRGSMEERAVRSNYPFSETAIFNEPGYPVMHFVEHSYADDDTNWWIPNRACLAAMIRSAGFTIAGSPAEDVFLCHRRPSL